MEKEMLKVYFASPWFNEEQAEREERVKSKLRDLGFDVWSPKENCVCPPDASNDVRKQVFIDNCKGIEQSQILLQGVIDLLAEFEDYVWIIDYKTDYVRDFNTQYEELKDRYAVQMKYYSKAIKEIYPTKKVSCYVYFLKVQQYIVYE